MYLKKYLKNNYYYNIKQAQITYKHYLIPFSPDKKFTPLLLLLLKSTDLVNLFEYFVI
jgi:hypothetical protein